MTETGERCPVCQRFPLLKAPGAEGCGRFAQVKRDLFASPEAEAKCYRIGLDLRESELATLRERHELESAVVEAAIEYIGPTGTDACALDTAVEALLAHRQRNNDGNR